MANKMLVFTLFCTVLYYEADANEPRIYTPNVTKIVDNVYAAGWTEGPVFDIHGQFYMVSPTPEDSPNGGGVLKVDIDNNKASVFVEPTIKNYHSMPNGADADQDGNLWITDLRLGLLKIDPSGKCQRIVERESSGELVQGMNDVTIDYTGNMWITAPVSKIAPHRYIDGYIERVSGSVYSYLPKQKLLTKLDSGFYYSNGIAVEHQRGEPKVLLVCEFAEKKVWSYDITGPGQVNLTSKRMWGSYPGNHVGGFDGVDFDDQGNLLVTNFGASSIEVFPPTGVSPIARIMLPFLNVTNIEFRPGTKQVYVTELVSGSPSGLWTFEWINKGMPKYRDLRMNSASRYGVTTAPLLVVAILTKLTLG